MLEISPYCGPSPRTVSEGLPAPCGQLRTKSRTPFSGVSRLTHTTESVLRNSGSFSSNPKFGRTTTRPELISRPSTRRAVIALVATNLCCFHPKTLSLTAVALR